MSADSIVIYIRENKKIQDMRTKIKNENYCNKFELKIYYKIVITVSITYKNLFTHGD